MKIAVASPDGQTVSMHFGRSTCFIVFDVTDNKIAGREVRDNTYTAHAKGECPEGEHHHHDQPHSHADIIAALHDCEVVLCGGMGWRAAEDLKQKGIQPFVLAEEMPPEQAVLALVAGSLKVAGTFCRCHE